MKRIITLGPLVFSMFWATSGFACSTDCIPVILSADGGTLPSNTLGIAVTRIHYLEMAHATLTDENGVEIPIELADEEGVTTINFLEPLKDSQTYTLRISDNCTFEPENDLEFVFETTSTHPFPTSFGTLSQTNKGRDFLGLTNCGDSFDVAWVDISLELTPEAKIWEDGLLYWTEVNGELWAPTNSFEFSPGESWLGKGVDRVVMKCDPKWVDSNTGTPRLYEGPQTVVMKAWSPGMSEILETEPFIVQLSCEEPPEAEKSSCATTHGASHYLPLLLFLGWIRRRSKN